jgi:hypothetical protein
VIEAQAAHLRDDRQLLAEDPFGIDENVDVLREGRDRLADAIDSG